MESSNTQKEVSTKENGRTIRCMAKGPYTILMATLLIKEIGKKTNSMEWVKCTTKIIYRVSLEEVATTETLKS